MMGGLAYMTGRSGDPLRAGSSVNDIMGGLFGAIGVMAALKARESTGLGQKVESALFENNVFLVAQHMMQFAVTGQPANPMPERISPWGIYDVFEVKGESDGTESGQNQPPRRAAPSQAAPPGGATTREAAGCGGQIFLAVVSDTQWAIFCEAFGFDDLRADERLTTNNGRVLARSWLMPVLRERLAGYAVAELVEKFEAVGLPFAPITRPHDLLEDPHLLATGGLAPITLPDGARAGQEASTVLFPFTLGGERPGVRLSPPQLGEHSEELLRKLGYSDEAIARLSPSAG
jgi:crotonobetainyl-CoA:carnitine CoA-transferase CaiB-like acyl-CoA transferase